jgi:sialidase-1
MLKVFCHYNVLIKVEMKDLKKNTHKQLSIKLVRNDEYVKFPRFGKYRESITAKLMSLLGILLYVSILSSCGNSQMSNKETSDYNFSDTSKTIVLKLEKGPNNPRNGEGDFITLKDGKILFVYGHFTGNTGDDYGHAYLASRFSVDSGKTWSKEDKIIVEQEGKLSVNLVSLLRLQNGSIALFNLKINAEDDTTPWMRISNDEGKTWEQAKQCIVDREGFRANKGIGFQLNNDRVIQLKDGRLLMPVAIHQVPTGKWGKESNKGSIWSYYSDDNGKTWLPGKEVPTVDSIMTQEPGVVELKNGDIFMWMRTDKGAQYTSYSKDRGITWSSAVRSNIPSPRSPASIKRIPSTGDLLLVWNNNGLNQKRTPLTTAISKDEGKSWEKIKNLEEDPDGCYCYTAIEFVGDYVLLGHGAVGLTKECLANSNVNRVGLGWIYK